MCEIDSHQTEFATFARVSNKSLNTNTIVLIHHYAAQTIGPFHDRYKLIRYELSCFRLITAEETTHYVRKDDEIEIMPD